MMTNRRIESIVLEGEEPLCNVSLVLGYNDRPAHDAWHRRSQVVRDAAIESSRRGDGRFLTGPGDPIVTITRAQTTLHGAMARAVKAMEPMVRAFNMGEPTGD